MIAPGVRRSTRCSEVARAVGARPVGTAGSYADVLLVEHPLPWPSDAHDVEPLAPLWERLTTAEDGRPTRVQLVVPRDPTVAEVVLYRHPGGPFRAYKRLCSVGDTHTVAARAIDLLGAGNAAEETDGIDLLVCTHGTRDRCCGAFGTQLFTKLAARFAESDHMVVRRSSHLGGHRFAPTVCVLPSGTLWAWVTDELVSGILERTLDVDVAVEHFRGCMGLVGAEVQALDAAVLARVGWSWLDQPRGGSVIDRDADRSLVQVRGGGPGSSAYEGKVWRVADIPVPVCGEPIEASVKHEPVWTVALSPTILRTAPGGGT